jgi:hypothetical protein
MIAGVVRHARTRRESRALVTHLLKAENAPRTCVLGGTLANDLPGAVADMERLRNSTSAEAAALHIHLSPSRMMTDAELERAAEIVRDHLGAADHPAAFVVHDKERTGGDGHRHAHLVLGRVSPSGKVLESGFEKIRLETAARIIEHELDEPATLGRHHASVVRWLRNNGRDDVASWLEAAHGPNPDRPKSAASSEKRQALVRQGIDLPDARAGIRDAWMSGGAEAIREAGYSIEPGRKSGVFVVARDGVEIGSLDRLTGEKRADIRNAMETDPDQISRKEGASENNQPSRKPTESLSQGPVGDPSSEKSGKFRPERSGSGRQRDALAGKKKSGAEIASLEIGEAAQKFAEGFRARLDDRLTVAAARRWIEDQRATLKGAVLESSQSPADADARREVARSRRELTVLEAASDALKADPSLATGGEKALMGAARRLHAERTAATREEIREAWASGGAAAIRSAGYEIAPGRDGAWRVLRGGEPLGTLHRLIGEKPADARQAMEIDPETWRAVASQSSSSAPDAEKFSNSRSTRTSESPQPLQKPVQDRSRSPEGVPSSGKSRSRRSPEEAVTAASGFLGRLDADLRNRIAELSRPERLPDPTELTDTRRRLSAAARELAAWEARHGGRVIELRFQTAAGRPLGFWAWAAGATSRYDVAARELTALSDERDHLLKPVSVARREVRILQTAQETRQAMHEDARKRELARLRGELSLLPDARAALQTDPAIVQGGGKALADAARRRQAERRAAESRRDLEALPEQSPPAPGR